MTFGVINDFNILTKEYNSSIMKFNNEVATDLVWKPFLQQKTELMKLQGDQNAMSKLVKGSQYLKVMPDEWSYSYKWFSRQDPRFDKSKWTFEKKDKAIRSQYFTVDLFLTNLHRNGLKKSGIRTKLEQISLKTA